MNLGDPFGRIGQQQKIDYASLRDSLVESGVNSRVKAEALLSNILHRALAIAVLVIVVAAMLVFFFPQQKIIVMVFSALPLLWLYTTTLKGRRLIGQYIKEEFPDDG